MNLSKFPKADETPIWFGPVQAKIGNSAPQCKRIGKNDIRSALHMKAAPAKTGEFMPKPALLADGFAVFPRDRNNRRSRAARPIGP